MAIYAALKAGGLTVTLPDPSGGTFNAAGDFDRLWWNSQCSCWARWMARSRW
jgi:hypothetical protein